MLLQAKLSLAHAGIFQIASHGLRLYRVSTSVITIILQPLLGIVLSPRQHYLLAGTLWQYWLACRWLVNATAMHQILRISLCSKRRTLFYHDFCADYLQKTFKLKGQNKVSSCFATKSKCFHCVYHIFLFYCKILTKCRQIALLVSSESNNHSMPYIM